MKRSFIIILLLSGFWQLSAQTSPALHHGTFKKKGKIGISSNPYKPDNWEKPYYDSSIKAAFPSDLARFPDKFTNKLVHLIGIVASVYIDPKDSAHTVRFLLDNKYWDYIEDYSIQDEVMFVSEKGDGKFYVVLENVNPDDLKSIKNFPAEQKLFLVYGNFKEMSNNYPVIIAQQIKFIDYEFYSTKIFSYDVERDKNGEVVTDKKSRAKITGLHFLKVAGKGQNK
jgi:hypothetical protein